MRTLLESLVPLLVMISWAYGIARLRHELALERSRQTGRSYGFEYLGLGWMKATSPRARRLNRWLVLVALGPIPVLTLYSFLMYRLQR